MLHIFYLQTNNYYDIKRKKKKAEENSKYSWLGKKKKLSKENLAILHK